MTVEDLRDLLQTHAESASLDYKERFNWASSSKSEKGQIIKDVLAFANLAGGGRIVFGVRDDNYDPVGLTQDDFESFDVTSFNSYLAQYTDPRHSCHLFKYCDGGRNYIVLEVPEFSSEPIICKKDLQTDTGENVLQRGALYIRKNTAESAKIDSAEDMRELLTRALKNRSDDLLQSIQTLLSGRQPIRTETIAYEESLTRATEQVERNIGKILSDSKHGFMTVIIRPNTDFSSLMDDAIKLRDRLRSSQIRYRGWSFPHEQNNKEHGDSFNIASGITSFTQFGRHLESFCLFTNGLFYWKSAMWEDSEILPADPHTSISFISLIYHTLEFILFMNRFYDIGDSKPDLNIDFRLDRCSGRKIVSLDPLVSVWGDHICHVDSITDATASFNLAESIADPRPLSAKLAMKVFHYFDFQLESKVMQSWQDKFLSRRF